MLLKKILQKEGILLCAEHSSELITFLYYNILVVAHTCHPSTQEVDAGGSQVEGQSRLHREFEAGLNYIVTSGPGCTMW